MTEKTVGREPVQIVEIRQPLCANTFGVAPCAATGTADQKCYNTRATCLDTPNFALGAPLSLWFSTGAVSERGVAGAPYIIPSLVSVSTIPTRVNIAGANPDAQGLGNRAMCRIVFADHPHTDVRVDPYLAGRSWKPMLRASFWTKWLARNKYRQNVEIRVYEGYTGQALAAMKTRTYFLQSITGPDGSGRITIEGKDILSRLEERKAQAPRLSPGKLYAAINSSAPSFEVANATTADYAASGTLRIGSECMTYGSRSTTANGVTFASVTRGTDGTTAAAHSADDAVQQCLRFSGAAPDSVMNTLLNTYGGVPSAWLDTANWATEVGNYIPAYRMNTLITEPTSVAQLVSEVQENCLLYVWWDERVALVRLKAVRGIDAAPPTITAEANILAGSFSLTERPRERASQVWIYYGQANAAESATTAKNYKYSSIIANLESETDELYGEPSVRKIFARWLTSGALADSTASKIGTRYVDIPSECTFRLDAKDRAYWVGDIVTISHHLDVDAFGVRRLRNWTIVSAEEVVPGEVVEYTAEDTTLYGRIAFIMANGSANYPGVATAPFKSCYIGSSAGLLSDGANGGHIT